MGARRRGHDPSRMPRARHRLRRLLAARARAPHRQHQENRGHRRARRPPQAAALQARQFRKEPRAHQTAGGDRGEARRQAGAGRARVAALARRGRLPDPWDQAAEVARAERRGGRSAARPEGDRNAFLRVPAGREGGRALRARVFCYAGSLTMSAVVQSKPENDSRGEAAIFHWPPRFVANGVPLVDFQEVTAGVSRWEDWCSAWSARAAVHEELGNKALAGGHTISAGEHFTRAAVCYHFGKFLFVNDMAQLKEAHRRAVECRNKALPHLDPPGERVAIPYEGRQLYGNLRKPDGAAKPPIVVMCM